MIRTMPRQWTNLHCHTTYSMLDGYGKAGEYAKRARELGMPALAITDHGSLHGLLDFREACISEGVKPLLGCEVYVARKTRHDRDDEERATSKAADELGQQHGPYHLTVLARNETGYRNLIRMNSRSYLEGYYQYPRTDRELLAEHGDGLMIMSGCLNGPVSQALMRGDEAGAFEMAAFLRDCVGAEYFGVEVMDHGIPEEKDAMKGAIEIARKLNAPLVPTGDSHYVHAHDAEIHDTMLCVSTRATVDQVDRFKFNGPHYYLMSYEEMASQFPEEWLANTMMFADKVDLDLQFGELYFPDYPLPVGEELSPYLERLVWEGMRRRYGDPVPEEQRARAQHELEVVRRMGFEGYFLVVWDLVNFARQQGIRVGPGRGSAAGSILSYALGITGLDPLRFNLLFERFLVEGRKSMPDIDLDFDDRYRDQVVNYAKAKYGDERVAHICTFHTVGARQAIRDAGRVLGFDYNTVDKLAKMVPEPVQGVSPPLEEALRATEMSREYGKGGSAKAIIDTAMGLEGLIRQPGIHAAGIVISKSPTTDFVPVMQKGEGKPVITQWDMDWVEHCGQLKVDFLGLRNMGVIDMAIHTIADRHGVTLDPDKLPLDDEPTYKMLCDGHSQGVFQLESIGMRELMLGMQPNCIEDLMALVSLFRPGPLGSNLDRMYIRRKHGKQEVTYDHPALEPVLADTQGVLLYQEQILAAARELAGFTAAEADDLRKAIGKKQLDKIGTFRQAFVDGCLRRGDVPHAVADKIYSDIEYFGGYGFNASHAASYALIAYWTAWLKCHYPPEYMAALLSSVQDDRDRTIRYLRETRRLGIRVRPPNVDLSEHNFRVLSEDEILFGLMSIGGVGKATADKLIAARDTSRPYVNIWDFLRRCPAELLDKGTIERFICTGALDHLVPRELERPLSRTRKAELLELERKYLRSYVSEHPLGASWEFVAPQVTSTVEALDLLPAGERITLAGVISAIEVRRTKRGTTMYTFGMEDLTGRVEVIVFNKDAERLMASDLQDGEILFINGRLAKEGDDEHSVNKIFFEGYRRPNLPEDVGGPPIRLRVAEVTDDLIDRLAAIIAESPGDSPVYLEFLEKGQIVIFRFKSYVSYEVEHLLKDVLRDQSV